MKKEHLHFRVHTLNLLNEICDNAMAKTGGILKIPMNIFKNLLADVAQRATELNDPILNKLMFDLALYELPDPTSKEYTELMDKVYKAAANQRKKEAKQKQSTK